MPHTLSVQMLVNKYEEGRFCGQVERIAVLVYLTAAVVGLGVPSSRSLSRQLWILWVN